MYVAARTKQEKTQVIAAVVNRVRRESPGGGFVKRDFHSGLWFEIGDDKARDKVGHAIRKAVEEMSKKSKKEKGGSKSKQAMAASNKLGGADNLDALAGIKTAAGDDFSAQKAAMAGGALRANAQAPGQGGMGGPSMDGLMMPSAFGFHQASLAALDSAQMPQSASNAAGARAHSMQQSMVVPPAASLFQQAGPHAFDLFGGQPMNHLGNGGGLFAAAAADSTLMDKVKEGWAQQEQASGLRYLF